MRIVPDLVNARKTGNFVLVPRDEVDYIDVSPKQLGLRGGIAGSVPGARRRQPRADGREHATPVGSAAACRSSLSWARAWKASRPAIPAPWCWPAATASSIGGLRAHHRACGRRASSHAAFPRGGQRHLSAHQVQALEPEHLHQPEAGGPQGRARDQRPGHCRRSLHGPRASWRSDATCWWPSCPGAATTSRTRSWSPKSW